MKEFEVIAFDIDGTLYPSWVLNFRLIPYVIAHLPFFLHYSKVRKILHKTAPLPDFFEFQARLLGEEMKISAPEAKEKIKNYVYDGLKPYFTKIKPFAGIYETFKTLKEAGFRLVLLSDFPPEQKGEIWGIKPFCELILGTEEIGALKPSKYPFGIMMQKLNVSPEKILYVGNSVKYDVRGAKNAGMKTAIILPWYKKFFGLKCREADINFCSYKEFTKIILNK